MNRSLRFHWRWTLAVRAAVTVSLCVIFGQRVLAEDAPPDSSAPARFSNFLPPQPAAAVQADRQQAAVPIAKAGGPQPLRPPSGPIFSDVDDNEESADLVGEAVADPTQARRIVATAPSAAAASAAMGQAGNGVGSGKTDPNANQKSIEDKLLEMGPDTACVEAQPIDKLTTNTVDVRPGDDPENVVVDTQGNAILDEKNVKNRMCNPQRLPQAPRAWTPLCYCWEAPSLCYGPLYFEETNLERYGYSQTYLRTVQPLVSSAHFFGTIPLMPYLLIAEPSRECVYTLGEYRPGSCVPFQWNYPYWSPCAAWQADDQ